MPREETFPRTLQQQKTSIVSYVRNALFSLKRVYSLNYNISCQTNLLNLLNVISHTLWWLIKYDWLVQLSPDTRLWTDIKVCLAVFRQYTFSQLRDKFKYWVISIVDRIPNFISDVSVYTTLSVMEWHSLLFFSSFLLLSAFAPMVVFVTPVLSGRCRVCHFSFFSPK